MRPSSRCVDSNEQKSILRGYWPPSLVQGRVLVVGESSTKDRLVAELGGVLCLLYPMQWFGPGHRVVGGKAISWLILFVCQLDCRAKAVRACITQTRGELMSPIRDNTLRRT